jgi:hypothetical protein
MFGIKSFNKATQRACLDMLRFVGWPSQVSEVFVQFERRILRSAISGGCLDLAAEGILAFFVLGSW